MRLRYWAGFDPLIVDEFGFDRIERAEAPQAADSPYEVVDARSEEGSAALVTDIDSEEWGACLGPPPPAMALPGRMVGGAIIVRMAGKSHGAHRGAEGRSRPEAVRWRAGRKKEAAHPRRVSGLLRVWSRSAGNLRGGSLLAAIMALFLTATDKVGCASHRLPPHTHLDVIHILLLTIRTRS